MEVYGNLDLKNVGSLLQFAIGLEAGSTFPADADTIVGRIAFFNKRVWIAAELVSGVASWVPLTNEINAFVYVQATTATQWTIVHNLNSGTPVVQIYDETNEQVIPEKVTPTDQNTVVVDFNIAVTGRAIVLHGDVEGNSKLGENVAFSHTQTAAATQWVIGHGLGYYPIVRVFTNDVPPKEIDPATVVHDSTMQVTLTFSGAQAGTVRLA